MENNIYLIHPQDDTTDFLAKISDFLFEMHGKDRFVHKRLGYNVQEHKDCVDLIEHCPAGSFVLFLGHGNEEKLHGARTNVWLPFLTQNQLHVFAKKKVFLLSCFSKELLIGQGIEGIGFGHLLSSKDELGVREIRTRYLYMYSSNVPDVDAIEVFNKLLVQICQTSLHDCISQNLTHYELYLNLKLRFNKIIAELVTRNNPALLRNVANLLLTAKNEMQLFQASNT